MDRRAALAVVRAASAALVFVAIAYQIAVNVDDGVFSPTRFFAFFTILSNTFGAVLFLVLAAQWRGPRSLKLDFLRGASVVYLTVTFIVVMWLLSGADLQVAVPWVDSVLHKLFPVVVVIDWLVDPPPMPIDYRRSLLWLTYPIVWVVLTLARGAADGWYPYPFLNPANGGYAAVAFYVVVITVGFIALSLLTVAIGNRLGARSRPGPN